jgi:hypothetical protein
MGWQETTALTMVALTAAIFLWRLFRPRKYNFRPKVHCGCASASPAQRQPTILFHARKGEAPRVLIR